MDHIKKLFAASLIACCLSTPCQSMLRHFTQPIRRFASNPSKLASSMLSSSVKRIIIPGIKNILEEDGHLSETNLLLMAYEHADRIERHSLSHNFVLVLCKEWEKIAYNKFQEIEGIDISNETHEFDILLAYNEAYKMLEKIVSESCCGGDCTDGDCTGICSIKENFLIYLLNACLVPIEIDPAEGSVEEKEEIF